MNILQILNKKRESQFKRLLIIYKTFDQKTKRIYGVPTWIRVAMAIPMVLAYLFHLSALRLISTLLNYIVFFRAQFKFMDPKQILEFGKLPSKNEKCRTILLYAKKCEFTEFDLDLVNLIFQNFKGHKSLIINCNCKKNTEYHKLGIDVEYQLVKPNWGYDFDGYAEIIDRFSKCDFSTLTFLNNSVLSLGTDNNWLDKMESEAINSDGIVGLVESISPRIHFQSFAFTISKGALTEPLIRWFSKIKPLKRKQAIVHFYELGLAKKIEDLAITCNYIFRFEDVQRISREDWSNRLGVYADTQIYQTIYSRTNQRLGVNPSHHHWRFLLDSGVPLIKRELVSSNPEDLPDIYDVLRQNFPDILKFKFDNQKFS